MSWTVADIPIQDGRIAVVTGANGGLGLETARALAGAGAHVVMAARNQDEGGRGRRRHPRRALRRLARARRARPRLAGLGPRRGGGDPRAHHERIDLLVNNAGVMGIPERRTADGFEMQFGVNHLGHWSLTALLMPALLRAPAGARRHRHEHGAPHGPRRRSRQPATSRAATARGGPTGSRSSRTSTSASVSSSELAAAGAPASSLIAHPGLSNTDLQAVSVRGDRRRAAASASSTAWRAAAG